MIGLCALCREMRDLCDSHYLPKSVYRIINKSHEPHDSSPVIVDVPGQAAFHSNRQLRKHLLCLDCEGRFSRHGENIVVPQCCHGEGKFALRDAMQAGTPTAGASSRDARKEAKALFHLLLERDCTLKS